MDQIMDQINFWLDGHMDNQYSRLAIIVGLAVITALTLRVFLLPLLSSHRRPGFMAIPAVVCRAVRAARYWAPSSRARRARASQNRAAMPRLK